MRERHELYAMTALVVKEYMGSDNSLSLPLGCVVRVMNDILKVALLVPHESIYFHPNTLLKAVKENVQQDIAAYKITAQKIPKLATVKSILKFVLGEQDTIEVYYEDDLSGEISFITLSLPK